MTERIFEVIPRERIIFDEPLKKHTTFRVGGPAKIFALPENAGEIISLVDYAKTEGIPFFVMGNGSNLLVSDNGYDGLIIKIGDNQSSITVEDEHINAEAGAKLSKISAEAIRASLSGFEHLGGIPGTLGGGVYMNAGAYGSEIKDVCERVTYLKDGEIHTVDGKKCNFSYRHSIFTDSDSVILSALLKLTSGNYDEIKKETEITNQKRRDKQPLEYPSAGSTFKRPEGHFAAQLIEECGLKGYTVGGAKVSEKHSGFVINTGNASASDIMAVISYVRETVERKTGVLLEPEVKIL